MAKTKTHAAQITPLSPIGTEPLSEFADQPVPPLTAEPTAVEIALRERIKELDCLYSISRIQELHFSEPEQFLHGVVNSLPRSWLYAEYACARIICNDKEYITSGFASGPWRLAADIYSGGKLMGVVEVCYPRLPQIVEDPFLPEEHILIEAVAKRVGSVLQHMKLENDLRTAHKQIQKEHQALRESNLALRGVLSQLEEEKREIKAVILANIQKVIMPIVYELELEITGRQRSYVTLLRQNLQDIASPFFQEISQSHIELTPTEVAICTMIRNGLSSKEIAQLRRISMATVRRHRENIRNKLGLTNRQVNLVTYLQGSFTDGRKNSAS